MVAHPAPLQLERCVQLLHATPLRRRYRLISTTPLEWRQLEQHLNEHLPARGLGWRLNQAAHSIVITALPDGSSAPLDQGLPIVIAAMSRAGARPPAAEVIRISLGKAKRSQGGERSWSWLLWPINLVSLSLSLSFLPCRHHDPGGDRRPDAAPGAGCCRCCCSPSLAVELALLLRMPFLERPAT
jgi:hypothetical protein